MKRLYFVAFSHGGRGGDEFGFGHMEVETTNGPMSARVSDVAQYIESYPDTTKAVVLSFKLVGIRLFGKSIRWA